MAATEVTYRCPADLRTVCSRAGYRHSMLDATVRRGMFRRESNLDVVELVTGRGEAVTQAFRAKPKRRGPHDRRGARSALSKVL